MGGDYSDYLVAFSLHRLQAGTSTFVALVLGEPSDLYWTQVGVQGNTYTLTFEPGTSRIQAESLAPIQSLRFVLNAIHLRGEMDGSFKPLSAEIRVLATGVVFKEYSFEGDFGFIG